MVAGRGRLGRSLARAFAAAGHRCELVPGRELPSALPAVELAFLAVSDPAVAAVAEAISPRLPVTAGVVHLGGSLPLGALAAAAAGGHPVGSFHPLQSFPVERPPEAFSGSLVAVDADDPGLLATLEALARDIGGRPRRVPDAERGLYHVAAVLASNLSLGLVATAASTLESAGWSREDAMEALVPLIKGVAANIEKEGLAGALIGPIRRGDAGAVRRHLDELNRAGLEEAAGVYRILGIATLELALEAGLEPATGDQIRVALTGPPAATGGDAR